MIERFLSDDLGATAIEYGLIAAIVGIGIIVGLGALSDGLNNLFNNVKTQLSKLSCRIRLSMVRHRA